MRYHLEPSRTGPGFVLFETNPDRFTCRAIYRGDHHNCLVRLVALTATRKADR